MANARETFSCGKTNARGEREENEKKKTKKDRDTTPVYSFLR